MSSCLLILISIYSTAPGSQSIQEIDYGGYLSSQLGDAALSTKTGREEIVIKQIQFISSVCKEIGFRESAQSFVPRCIFKEHSKHTGGDSHLLCQYKLQIIIPGGEISLSYKRIKVPNRGISFFLLVSWRSDHAAFW